MRGADGKAERGEGSDRHCADRIARDPEAAAGELHAGRKCHASSVLRAPKPALRRRYGSVKDQTTGRAAPESRALRRRIALVWSWETRDSVTPSTSPISRRVSSS
jgi:hypothetical protein